MKTTLNIIKSQLPYNDCWNKLLISLNKREPDNEKISLIYILRSIGIEDAILILKCFKYKEYCSFLADVVESILHLYVEDSPTPHQTIKAIRKYHKGEITRSELDSIKPTYTLTPTSASAYTIYAIKASASNSPYNTIQYTIKAASLEDKEYDTRIKKWNDIEQLFIKHFK